MAINEWPEDQRPRERLIKHGASAISDAELLAVFLRVGVKGKSAVDLGRDMIKHFGSLSGLFAANMKDFSSIHGLGAAKYAQLHAVLELAKRAISEELQENASLSSPQAVKNYLQLMIGNKPHESFAILFLDIKNRLIKAEELFRGTLNHASVLTSIRSQSTTHKYYYGQPQLIIQQQQCCFTINKSNIAFNSKCFLQQEKLHYPNSSLLN